MDKLRKAPNEEVKTLLSEEQQDKMDEFIKDDLL